MSIRTARLAALTLAAAGLILGGLAGSLPVIGLGLVGSILLAALNS